MMGRPIRLGGCCLLFLLGVSAIARAEYRAYEIEIVDRYLCASQEQKPCKSQRVVTSFAPDHYVRVHGGEARLGVLLLATWVCRGDTSNYDPVCPRPAPRNAKFASGAQVEIGLSKHVTAGWSGTVELVYYQPSISSNVYGVRFAERGNLYARYFEKDLLPASTAPAR